MTKIPERFLWATELLDVKPTDNILEIGCGAGLMAEQIANRLTGGQLIAIDKSSAMLEKAKRRNKRFVDDGTARFLAADFLEAKLLASYFDAIVAFNVNFFWKGPAKELQIIKQSLKPAGQLYIFHQGPFEIDVAAVEPIKQELINNAFEIIDVQEKKLLPASAFCIVTKPVENS
jgi:SAM-dependent methyltransferase